MLDNFDYTSLFDTVETVENNPTINPNQGAIDYVKELLLKAYNELEIASNKTFKSCGKKSVFVGSEMEGVNVSIDKINAKRLQNRIKNAKNDIERLTKDLYTLENSTVFLPHYVGNK
jgi:hypothetical protein